MRIGEREINQRHPPYLVAEASANHLGNINNALKLIDEAKAAGADAIKFQCYRAETITLDCEKSDFIIKDGLWKGRKLYELYKKCETPRAWFPQLFARAKEIGITAFASVFQPDDVDFLEELGCPAYKIASMEITDVGLVQYALKTGKPVIISTGMTSASELEELKWGFEKNTVLLHCVSGYPTPLHEANLGRGGMNGLWLHCPLVGISDHTPTWEVPIAATALGACMIEKHMRLAKYHVMGASEDEAFSLAPYEFKHMARTVRAIWQAMQPHERKSEESSRQLRRSLYAVENIKCGAPFTEKNVRSIRPAYGLPPSMLPDVLESIATCDIERGTPLERQMLDTFAEEKLLL